MANIIFTPPLETTMSTLQGQRVLNNRFQLQEMVGSGGMGVVYRGIDRKTQQEVAIKLLNYEMSDVPEAKLALEREARKEQQCQHPNLIKTFGFYQEVDAGYKVMEYLKGNSLKRVMQEFKLHRVTVKGKVLQEILQIIRQMLMGLSEMHGRGLVHSDIKPSNVIILPSGQVKLFDFGIVRSVHNPAVARTTQTPANEASIFDPTTVAAFTPVYASFEMLTGLSPSQSDDVYAVGCILFELLSGVHPYHRVSATEAVENNMTCQCPKGLKSSLWDVLKPAVALRKIDRYPSAAEFLAALDAVQKRKRFWFF